MKKFLLFSFLLLIPSSFAIDWMNITTPLGKNISLDRDSIVEKGHYYFYNVMVNNKVITLQSSTSSGFSKTIKVYTKDEYVSLDGNYEEISKNKASVLEPVMFGSVANTCFLKIKGMSQQKSNSGIILE